MFGRRSLIPSEHSPRLLQGSDASADRETLPANQEAALRERVSGRGAGCAKARG